MSLGRGASWDPARGELKDPSEPARLDLESLAMTVTVRLCLIRKEALPASPTDHPPDLRPGGGSVAPAADSWDHTAASSDLPMWPHRAVTSILPQRVRAHFQEACFL